MSRQWAAIASSFYAVCYERIMATRSFIKGPDKQESSWSFDFDYSFPTNMGLALHEFYIKTFLTRHQNPTCSCIREVCMGASTNVPPLDNMSACRFLQFLLMKMVYTALNLLKSSLRLKPAWAWEYVVPLKKKRRNRHLVITLGRSLPINLVVVNC